MRRPRRDAATLCDDPDTRREGADEEAPELDLADMRGLSSLPPKPRPALGCEILVERLGAGCPR